MRYFLLCLTGIGLLFLSACSFRSSSPEAEVSPASPASISKPPEVAADRDREPDTAAVEAEIAASEFTLDQAPAPPAEAASPASAQPLVETNSAEETFNSIARVLQGAIEGTAEEADAEPKGSVISSIGRALSKAFQEAAANENAGND